MEMIERVNVLLVLLLHLQGIFIKVFVMCAARTEIIIDLCHNGFEMQKEKKTSEFKVFVTANNIST